LSGYNFCSLHFIFLTSFFKNIFMVRVIVLAFIGVSFLCGNTAAQRVNTDSLKLISKISDDQLKLGKLQNTVGQKTQHKTDDSLVAQESADKNSTAASRLSNDPQNKQSAKEADNAAGTAKSNSKKARKAAADLDKVHKEIADLQGKIASEQAQLSRFTGTTNMPAVQTTTVQQDTTQRR
jgi:lipopolysaccharide export LptBFGC system permease protein LptF